MKCIADVYGNVLDFDSVLPFGKYKNESFQRVIEKDKNYLRWLFTKTDFCAINNVNEDLLKEVLNGEARTTNQS